MKEKLLKKLSAINVKILQQEKLLKYYVDYEGDVKENSSKLIARKNNLKSLVEIYKKRLQEAN